MTSRKSATDGEKPAASVVRFSLDCVPDEMSSIVQKKQKFPKSVFFIVGNEFCERFSYYGMRTVLMLYFIDQLGMTANNATVIYHVFSWLCFFTPILGAMLADSWLGKFRTIFYVSLIYALGNIVLSLASMPPLNLPMTEISMVGLFLISLGTGGIKPCVSAFGGDQFDQDNVKYRERYFFIFYFSINAGALISTFITPILRADVHCFGGTTCFPLAFGLPASLMIVAIILFVSGKPLYRMIPPEGNVVIKVCRCVGHALSNKWSAKEKKEHWLDYAGDTFDKRFISDVRAALRVLYMYIPLPVYWALSNQQGSRWTLQAKEMDGKLGPNYIIQPDQMQVVNPLLVLLFIPLFESLVYPLLGRWNLLVTPLRRIFWGGMLAAVAFVVAGLLQYDIENRLPAEPASNHVDIWFINSSPCNLTLRGNGQFSINVTIAPMETYNMINYNLGASHANYTFSVTAENCDVKLKDLVLNLPMSDQTAYTTFLSSYDGTINMNLATQKREKPADGKANIRIAYELGFKTNNSVITLKDGSKEAFSFHLNDNVHNGITVYNSLIPGSYEVYVPMVNGTSHSVGTISIYSGAGYTCTVNAIGTEGEITLVEEVDENTVKLLWQVPQIVIITCAEIMFSITGLQFSYSQAPVSMKSVLQAAWLMTDAFGHVIVIIITEIKFFDRQSFEYFLFAGIMTVVMGIFALMAMNYEYVTPRTLDPDELDDNGAEKL